VIIEHPIVQKTYSLLLQGVGLCIIIFGLSACASSSLVSDLMVPLNYIKNKVVSEMPNGVRAESLNGRQFTSGYFSPSDFTEDATDKPLRAFAVVTILGAGRPYTLDVEVTKEQRSRGTKQYESLGKDKLLAKSLASRLRTALADRREDRNVIDDFRAF
jgi:hypothetical protein